MEATPWAETLGYIANEKSLAIYVNEKFFAYLVNNVKGKSNEYFFYKCN